MLETVTKAVRIEMQDKPSYAFKSETDIIKKGIDHMENLINEHFKWIWILKKDGEEERGEDIMREHEEEMSI